MGANAPKRPISTLKNRHEGYQPTDKLDTSNPPKGSEHPHDLIQKGLKYDALKKRNEELLEALKALYDESYLSSSFENALTTPAIKLQRMIEKALKNNSND